jgi:hypothetical protein
MWAHRPLVRKFDVHRSNNERTARALLLAAAVSVALAPRVAAAADTWTGGPGEWSDASHWSTGLPAAGDDALNTTGAAIDFNTTATVNSFLTNGAFTLSGGRLTGGQASAASQIEVDNLLTFQGGGISNVTLNGGTGSTAFTTNNNNFIKSSILNADLNVGDGFVQLYKYSSTNSTVDLAGGEINLHDANATLDIAATGTFHGQGLINEGFSGGTLTNNGLISADVSGQDLILNVSNINGSGTYQGVGGGTLLIGGVLKSTNSSIVATSGVVMINGGEVSGTIASATGSGLSFSSNINNTMSNATIDGVVTMGNGSFVSVGATTINGTVNLASTANGINIFGGLTIAAGSLMHGYGKVDGASNLGEISADAPGKVLALSGDITGSGSLVAQNGGTLSIGGELDASGTTISVDGNPASVVEVNGGTLTGSLGITTGASLIFSGNTVNYISNATIAGSLIFPSQANVHFSGNTTINGTIAMSETTNGIQLSDANLELGPSGLLHGYGTIYENSLNSGGFIINAGTINADVFGRTLSVGDVGGGGTFEATGGGMLVIGRSLGGTGATVHADTGTVLIDGGGVEGTFAAASGTGISFSSNPANYLINASVNGVLTFAGAAFAQVYYANDVGGAIDMSGTSNGIELHNPSAVLTIDSKATLQGFGQIYGAFDTSTVSNAGTVNANVSGQTLAIDNTTLTGGGTFEATGGGTLSIGAHLTGSSAVIHADTGTVLIDGGGIAGTFAAATGSGISFSSNSANVISGATVNGVLTFVGAAYAQLYQTNTFNGSINIATTSNGIQLHDSGSSLNIGAKGQLHGYGSVYQLAGGATVANSGTVAADVPGQTLGFSTDNFSNSGRINVVPGAVMSVFGLLVQSAGMTDVNGQLNLENTLRLQGGILGGDGTVNGSVDNSGGIVAPGNSPGLLTLMGNYQQDAGGAFDVELGGYTAGITYDQLDVSGQANLSGNISVDLVNGFVPHIGDTFTVLVDSGQTGSFATQSSDDGLTYNVIYNPTNVQITLTAIPEPAAITLSLAAVSLLGIRRRRK